MKFIDRPSPNYNARQDGRKVSLIVLHFTGSKSAEDALDILTDENRDPPVSSHYLIHEDGRIFRLVDEADRAWHAGRSSWFGMTDINSSSIGIEISNRDRNEYTTAQMKALIALCRDIMQRHNIPPQNILGHSDIAPDRKDDPGYHFPWKMLVQAGLSHLPRPNLRDRFNAAAIAKNPRKLAALFEKAGYGLGLYAPADGGARTPNLSHLVAAFQQRYEPEVYTRPVKGGKPGRATARTVALLRAVIRGRRSRMNML